MVKLNIKLPNHFLDEEVRNDYVVTSDMKKVWAIELDLLNELLRVCKKNNIKIFASGGTMLGAVRHNGFIPWDDDIDMMMFREDYNKLCQIAENEFKHPYFFQTEWTDRGSLRGHAQLRNSETTGILKNELDFNYTFNQGIFIDIFPLDTVIDNERLFKKQFKKVQKYKKRYRRLSEISDRYKNCSNNKIKHFIKTIISATFGKMIKKQKKPIYDFYYKKYEDECQRYNYKNNTKYISTLSFMFDNEQHFKYRCDYENLIDMDFEFIKIPIGANYDHALTKRYGNYKLFEKGTSYHGGIIFDVDKPYTEYLEKNK